jgi:hypothetical protein
MTKPTDDIRPFRPYGGPLTLLQLLTVIGLAGLAATGVAYLVIAYLCS